MVRLRSAWMALKLVSTHFLAQTPLWSLAILFVDLFLGEKHCLTPIEKPAQRLIHRPVLRSILPSRGRLRTSSKGWLRCKTVCGLLIEILMKCCVRPAQFINDDNKTFLRE